MLGRVDSLHKDVYFQTSHLKVFFYLRSGLTSYLGFSETTPSVVLLMKALDYQLLNNFCTSLKVTSNYYLLFVPI